MMRNMDQSLKMENPLEDVLLALPSCCGKRMKIKSETGKFIEAWCSVCDGVAYVKNIVSY